MSKLATIFISLIFKFIIIFNKRIKLTDRSHLLLKIIEYFEKENRIFLTYHLRPMDSAAVCTLSERVTDMERLGIVIQGPILKDNNFTFETVKMYQKLFKGADIVLSTWEEEETGIIKEFREIGVDVLLNRQPEYKGQSNINLQVVSARSGVKRAQELGAVHVLKTRTDQRIYSPNVADFLFNVTDLFPVQVNYEKQRKRIIGVSLNTFKYRMYGLSDMLSFGHIDDMLLYWDVELDQRVFSDKEAMDACATLESFARWRVCEVYLATEFLMKVGRQLEWSLKDSWGAFADHFCVVDSEQLDLFWPKYNRLEHRWLNYTGRIQSEEMTFREWLNIYKNISRMDVPENLLCLAKKK